MNKYRFTIRSQWVTTVDLDADNETDAYEEIRAYIEDGGMGDESKGYWNTRDYDEAELICQYCDEPVQQFGSLPCCQKWIEAEVEKRKANEL